MHPLTADFFREQDMVAEGKIKHLAVTNFDTDNFKASRDGGINLVSNQVQFSLIDQRPLAKMAPYCGAERAKILAYGTGSARLPLCPLHNDDLARPLPTHALFADCGLDVASARARACL